MKTRKFESYIRLHHMCHGCKLRPTCEREVGECARADVAAYKHQELDPTLGGVSLPMCEPEPDVYKPTGLAWLGDRMLCKENQRKVMIIFGALVGTFGILTVIAQLVMWAERSPK